jgi:hypothetical protein
MRAVRCASVRAGSVRQHGPGEATLQPDIGATGSTSSTQSRKARSCAKRVHQSKEF